MDFAVIVDNVEIAIELEGFDKTNSGHGQTQEQHHRFMLRQQALIKGGWTSFPITNAQFKRDPMYYANEIRRMVIEGRSLHSESVAKTSDPPPVNNQNKQQLFTVFAIVLGLFVGIFLLLTRTAPSAPSIVTTMTAGALPVIEYKSCDALREVYPDGIARSVADKERKQFSDPTVDKSIYDANKGLDRNRDGVMCD